MNSTLLRAKRRLLSRPVIALLAVTLGLSLLIGVGTVLSLFSSSRGARGAGEQSSPGNLQETPQPVTPTAYLPLIAKDFCPAALQRMPFGVQMLSEVDDPAAITLAHEAGAHWVRTGLSWATIEPTNTDPANFIWTTYDQRFANLAAAGLTPIVTIRSNPTWAAEYPCGPITDTNLVDFGDFLSALVSRYKDPPYNVKYWELYNEPDNGDPITYPWLGGCWGNNGAEYAHMLSIAYPAIKAADPEAQVVFGGIAYDWFTDDELFPGNPGPFVRSFIVDVLSNGGGDYFDVMNFHHYPAFTYRWEELYDCAGVSGKGVICKTAYLKDKLATYGVDKPFLCSEVCQWSGEEHGGSEEKQSAYVVQSMVRGTSADLEAVIWFTLVDFEEEWKYGLLNPDYSPKPAYSAYQTLAKELAGAQYIRRLGTGYAEVEGYVFSTECDTREKAVLWTNPVGSEVTRDLSFPASALRVVQKEGDESIIYDGGAGDLDNAADAKVTIRITGSPIYVEEYP